MEITDTAPDDWLATVDRDDIRDTLIALDSTIRDALPDRARDLWQGKFWGGTDQTIIGYGHILQPRPSGDDVAWFLVGLARQTRNYSLYVNAADGDGYISHAYADRLGRVKLGAASIGFTNLEQVDHDGLQDMLEAAHRSTPPDSW